MLKARGERERNKIETLRASGLHELCGHKRALTRFFPEIDGKKDKSDRTIFAFAVGTAMHRMYQEDLLPDLAAHGAVLEGCWTCHACRTVVDAYPGERYHQVENSAHAKWAKIKQGEEPPKTVRCTVELRAPTTLPVGNAFESTILGEWLYVEPYAVDPETGLTGHCDGILRIGTKRYLLELKTIKEDDFKSLREDGPKYAHVFQSNVYMSKRFFNVDGAIIFYLSKDRHDTQEFVIDANPEIQARALDHVRWWKDSESEKTLPPRICDSPSHPVARWCTHREVCFNDMAVGQARKKFLETITV